MKYAIVTGGTRGIGKQICMDLLSQNYFVFTSYQSNKEIAQQCELDFSALSQNFRIIRADHSKQEDLIAFVHIVKQTTNTLDCFIGNAGSTLRKLFLEISNEEWENLFRINLHSNFYLLRDLDSLFPNEANITFIGSLMGEYSHASSIAYGVSKAALHAFALNLVKEYAPRKIRVNVVAPGFVETEWQKDKPKDIRSSIENKTALGRFSSVDEIVSAVNFCLENTFLNGAVIDVNGGYCFK